MLLQALKIGSEAITHICTEIEAWAGESGKSKRTNRTPGATVIESQLSSLAFAPEIKAIYKETLGIASVQAICHLRFLSSYGRQSLLTVACSGRKA